MNLMELLVKIGVDDQASEKIGKISQKIGGGLKTAAKIGTAAVGAASAGIAALTTASVKNYAEYEQLVGGVETLFKGSADKVKKYAEDAYKSAGMSVNDYMETVTGFSASMIQSLGGDTEAAAELSNQALIDMSDNANKMGTSIESIRYAYGGFAKGNFTMLDNLKLGYGGTQEEMKRLIKRANELDKTVDANSMSFSNIVKAIHAVQKEMGIMNATADEAATTIEGSVGSMKAAWSNLVIGFGNDSADLGVLIDEFVDSAITVGENVVPRVRIILERIMGVIVEKTPQAIQAGLKILTENLPKVLEFGAQLLKTLGEGILSALPEFSAKLPEIIRSFGNFITENLPQFLDMGISILVEIGKGILNAIPDLLLVAGEVIDLLFNYLVELVGKFFETGKDVVKQIWEGVKAKWAEFTAAFLADWNSLIEDIKEFFTDFLSIGSDIVDNIKQGISDAWGGLKRWFNGLWDDLFGNREVDVDVNYNSHSSSRGGHRLDGSHANGLRYVPFDGYMAELHRGERVLTAGEAQRYNGGGGITINQHIETVPQTPAEFAATTASYFEEARWALDGI